MDPNAHPAAKIKSLLRSNSTTVQQLSARLGLAIESVRDILDEREMPPPSLLRRIAECFGVRETFFQDGPPPFEDPTGHSAREKGRPAPGRQASGKRPCRQVDLAELAARQQALIDLLISKKVFSREEFDVRLEILRARVIARKMAVEKPR
jgi:transcriptional regulator with XRE-family HTH domain